MADLSSFEKIHFIAIGGIGMSALAKVLLAQGYDVRGSDNNPSAITEQLQEMGAKVFIGHKAEQIGDAQLVVVSSAIKYENEELQRAEELNLPIWHRSEMLAALIREKKSIAISGTHGKTTTSFLLTSILKKAGFDPAALLGGELDLIGGNAIWGKGDYLVAEADESDGSFLNLPSQYAIITNIEEDHLDYYEDLNQIENTFVEFLNNLPSDGHAFLGLDSEIIRKILPRLTCSYTTYGLVADAKIRAEKIKWHPQGSTWQLYQDQEFLAEFELSLLGEYNLQNALGALACSLHLGLDLEQLKLGLSDYVQGKRRYEYIDTIAGIKFVEDYAHHPTEVKNLIQAALAEEKKRLIIVFQPHLYSRTLFFRDAFGQSFKDADLVVLIGIFPSRERMPDPEVRSSILVDAIKEFDSEREVVYIEDKKELVEKLPPLLREGDLVIFTGAGDINQYGREVVDLLAYKRGLKN